MNQNVYLQYKIAKKYNNNLKYATQMKKNPTHENIFEVPTRQKILCPGSRLRRGVYR